jgi:hypothetical protein
LRGQREFSAVGRAYGGILGLLAFSTLLLRGICSAGGSESVLLQAWLGLVLFAALGLLAGSIAAWLIRRSVQDQLTAEAATAPSVQSPSNEQAA